MPDAVRTADHYPYSCRTGTGAGGRGRPGRLCPICDHAIDDAVYAVHWEAVHVRHARFLRHVEWNPALLDAWAGQGFPLPDEDPEPALTASEIRYLADVWVDEYPSFMDAVFDALGGVPAES